MKRPSLPNLLNMATFINGLAACAPRVSKIDLCIYRARRRDGERWMVKVYGRNAAEFSLKAQARTFADFAPLLLQAGTCPACLEKPHDLRAHIGSPACAARREHLQQKGARS